MRVAVLVGTNPNPAHDIFVWISNVTIELVPLKRYLMNDLQDSYESQLSGNPIQPCVSSQPVDSGSTETKMNYREKKSRGKCLIESS